MVKGLADRFPGGQGVGLQGPRRLGSWAYFARISCFQKKTWFSCPKSSNNWKKVEMSRLLTDGRTVESREVFCLSRIRNNLDLSLKEWYLWEPVWLVGVRNYFCMSAKTFGSKLVAQEYLVSHQSLLVEKANCFQSLVHLTDRLINSPEGGARWLRGCGPGSTKHTEPSNTRCSQTQ